MTALPQTFAEIQTFAGQHALQLRLEGMSCASCVGRVERVLMGSRSGIAAHRLPFYEDHSRASADVKAVGNAHLARIAEKIAGLRAMEATLTHLAQACAGDDRPDCPILTGLETGLPQKAGAALAAAPDCCGSRAGRTDHARRHASRRSGV